MLLLDLLYMLGAFVSFFWFPLLVIWILYRVFKKRGSKPAETPAPLAETATSVHSDWHTYIASFRSVVKTKAEKNLIQAILERRPADELYMSRSAAPLADPATTTPSQAATSSTETSAPLSKPLPAYKQPLDNSLLLLYFGAFLLVAAAGLFVALAEIDGFIRAVVVLLTSISLYLSGWWLLTAKEKLRQVGISFMGSAMVIAPLTGVAWYNLVTSQTQGALIYLVTSLACFALYAHAASMAKNSFMSYLLIGSFVSTVESALLNFSAPSYVLVWALILCAMLLQHMRHRQIDDNLAEASATTTQLLTPLSILSSLVIAPTAGLWQVAITLALSTAYYSLVAYQSTQLRATYAVAAQISGLSALATGLYSITDSYAAVGNLLSGAALIYAFMLMKADQAWSERHQLAPIAAASVAIACFLTIAHPWSLFGALTSAMIVFAIVWIRSQDTQALSLAGLLLIALPLVFGQYVTGESLSAGQQLSLGLIPTVILYGLTVWSATVERVKKFYPLFEQLVVINATVLLVLSWLTDSYAILLGLGLALSFSFLYLQRTSTGKAWWTLAGAVLLVPVGYSALTLGIDSVEFFVSVFTACLLNAGFSLVSREESLRWVTTFAILLCPLAIGGGSIGIHWHASGYAYGYLLSMAACVLGRAIARGKWLRSTKVPIASYYSHNSYPYLVGYAAAAMLALLLSLQSPDSQTVTSVVITVIMLCQIYISILVEKNGELLAIVPILAQALLFSTVRPELSDATAIGVIAIVSTLLAGVLYLLSEYWPTELKTDSIRTASVLTAYVGTGLVLAGASPDSPLLPVSLGLAGILTLYHYSSSNQGAKEVGALVIAASIHWLLLVGDVTSINAHAHVLALFFGLLAVWRHNRQDASTAMQYIKIAYFIATVPLILSALGDAAGSEYGLALICQQIVFMLLGVTTNIRYLLKAGLWVSIGSILYQLRGLGWAFLAILAVIIIAIATYRLNKHDSNT